MKSFSVFMPEALVERARSATSDWAEAARQTIVDAAQPWFDLPDDELWRLPVGHRISRSWQVWSSGQCPTCNGEVPEYEWIIEPLERPWKVMCPHCSDVFPKNDFAAFYASGLDEAGEFDPFLADRKLLVREDGQEGGYGVDDGEGYVDGPKRWRFIACYLVYGQWKFRVVEGTRRLANAYVVTGDPAYAAKAGILLDRASDLHPRMDYSKQGWCYEIQNVRGCESMWHDACIELRELAFAYDAVRPALADNPQMMQALQQAASRYALPGPKRSEKDIAANIEQNLLKFTFDHADRIMANYPNQTVTKLILRCVLEWPDIKDWAFQHIGDIVDDATPIDGTTGEKGTPGYSSIGATTLASTIERFTRPYPELFDQLIASRDGMKQAWRFHIDIWCNQSYYPSCGDGGWFANPARQYAGLPLGAKDWLHDKSAPVTLAPSYHTFMYRLFKATGDVAYAQVLHHANRGSVEGLPYDLFIDAEQAAAMQRDVQAVVDEHGPTIDLPSTNKEQWALAVMRSGKDEHARSMWLDYDAGWSHSHFDCLNLGLFAHGLDLLPDLGYTPTSYGGHDTPEAVWYIRAAAHNTVVVDGQDHNAERWGKDFRIGTTTLFADGEVMSSIRADAAVAYNITTQYERTASMVDITDDAFYVVDVFRVTGGHDHARFFHSHFADLETHGLSLSPDEPYGHGTMLRDFHTDPSPGVGWAATWHINDEYGIREEGADVKLRLTDLTHHASVSTCESWLVKGNYNSKDERWIPNVMTRRGDDSATLQSTFVAVLEPYEGSRRVRKITRLPVLNSAGTTWGDSTVAVELVLADGRSDLHLAVDVADAEWSDSAVLREAAWDLTTNAQLCFARRDADEQPVRIVLCHGSRVTWGTLTIELAARTEHFEAVIADDVLEVIVGDASAVNASRGDAKLTASQRA